MNIAENRQAVKYTHKEQLLRILWMFIGQPLFRCSFRTLFGWRRFLLRLFGAKVGKNVNVYNTAVIYFPWHLSIGDWSSIGEYAFIYNLGPITIGKNVTISQRAHLCAGTHDYTDSRMTLLKPPIMIDDQAWICADAFVGPGVHVGEGTVLGARGVSVKDLAPWAIYAGNPARVIKQRELNDVAK